ncbi:MAG: L,D-transpeptidase family protein [Bradyrhizobium sp.]|nr:L,D-transpeptidase family protein [Bradyrhizobium sp.]
MHVVYGRNSIFKRAGQRFWQVAALAAAGAMGGASRGEAAFSYWQYSGPSFSYRHEPTLQPRRPKLRHSAKADAAVKDTAAKPQGPIIIAISINKQQVKIYDANGLFAQAPVSTGMHGHPTPMGVFSVIQKHKWHHSNIYSDAPMPYMQRITWSGVAMHAGVLPGYPASHGCIRMSSTFAIKMWNWTRLGARVVVTPGEIMPISFSHRQLPGVKIEPPAAAQIEGEAPLAVKADKGAPNKKPETAEAKLKQNPRVGHADVASPANEDDTALRDETHTADASDKANLTTSDLPSSQNDGATVDAHITKPTPQSGVKPDSVEGAAKADGGDAMPEGAAKISGKASQDRGEADAPRAEEARVEQPKSEAANRGPAAVVETADARKDPTRLPDAAKAAAAKAEAAKRAGPISVLISRKDSKLYARQNFSPLFEVPVMIAATDRSLGTHVFTVEVDKDDPNVLHWSVVSLPLSVRGRVHEERAHAARSHDRAPAATVDPKPLPLADSPAEALDRITIAADAMKRITDALTTGSSIIVSDQGINQGETGDGTDFIVPLR